VALTKGAIFRILYRIRELFLDLSYPQFLGQVPLEIEEIILIMGVPFA